MTLNTFDNHDQIELNVVIKSCHLHKVEETSRMFIENSIFRNEK